MDRLKMHSPDLVAANIERLAELFPGCVTERQGADGTPQRAVDFDLLRQALSDHLVEGPQERYRLDWPGKREALLAANAPIAKTLRPCRDESVHFDTTQNLFIEGDNLDALKLLQETYLGKVKMIFIDPPYNTGSDLIYDDDFSESSLEFLARTEQSDQFGNRLVLNRDSNGRFHSDWASMIYSRTRLAMNLLRDDGVLFVTIDDREAANLRQILDECFGEANFVANIIWQSRTSISDDHEISPNHNHVLVYARNKSFLRFWGEPLDESEYRNDDFDERGPWKLVPLDANKPGGDTKYSVRNPSTGEEFYPPEGRSWSINSREFQRLLEDGRVMFGLKGDSAPKRKLFLKERLAKGDSKTPSSILLNAGTTKDGTGEVAELFGSKRVFDYPKPTLLIERLVQYGTAGEPDAIVVDFFAGSATTAHSVMKFTAKFGGARRWILVQAPEETEAASAARKLGCYSIADVAKERIRHAGRKVKVDHALREGIDNLDIGFRVLKIDTSNMAEVYYRPDELKQDDLLGQIDNIRPGRTAEDLLFQVLLDWGVDLALPIAREEIDGREVFFVDGNALAACFVADGSVDEAFVKQLAARQPLRVVFRDAGFASDNARVNVEQIFKTLSPSTEVRTL